MGLKHLTVNDKGAPNGVQGLNSSGKTDYVNFEEQSSLADIEGRVGYVDKALALKTDIPGSTQSLGQEFWTRVINNTGVSIPNGTPVHSEGYDAVSGRLQITVADKDDVNSSNVIGLTTSTINDGEEGFVTSLGFINDVDTSSFSTGEHLWLGASGTIVNTAPTSSVFLGYANKIDATTGSIYVTFNRANRWQPPQLTLGDIVTSGASLFANTGCGYQASFDASSDDEVLFNVPLRNGGLDYDGSDLALKIDWKLYSTPPIIGSTVEWQIDYAFIKDDGTQDAYTLVDDSTSDVIDVQARDEDVMYSDILSTMSGVAGATVLLITLRRNSTGLGSDTYLNSADLYGIELIKL